MPIGQMRQTIFKDQTQTQLQAALNDQFAQISKIPFMNGVWLKGQALVMGQANALNTGLGVKVQGYIITSNSTGTSIWNDAFSGDTQISLRCSANTTVDVWVF